MKAKRHYHVRWAEAGQPSLGNVSFVAGSDYHAKLMADKIGREIGLPNMPRTIYQDNRCVECRSWRTPS